MFKITATIVCLFLGASTAKEDPYSFKCAIGENGRYSCNVEGLQETLDLDEGIDLNAISRIAKPWDLQIWMW